MEYHYYISYKCADVTEEEAGVTNFHHCVIVCNKTLECHWQLNRIEIKMVNIRFCMMNWIGKDTEIKNTKFSLHNHFIQRPTCLLKCGSTFNYSILFFVDDLRIRCSLASHNFSAISPVICDFVFQSAQFLYRFPVQSSVFFDNAQWSIVCTP